MRKWLLLTGAALVFVVSAGALAQDATEEMPMGEMMMTGSVVCDQDLIVSRYIAEYYFNFAAVVDQLAAEGMTTVDLAAYDAGQYTPYFASMMGMMDEMMAMPETLPGEDGLALVLDMMRMEDSAMMAMEMMPDAGMYTALAPAVIAGEAAECTALRDALRRFFDAVAYANEAMMMDAGM